MNKKQVIIKKTLPHNFLAERMVLSCLLINLEAVESTIKVLPLEAFYFKNHQEIYKIIIVRYKNKLPIDILSLTIFFQNTAFLEKIGGMIILIDLLNQVPNLTHLEEYICLVKEKFLRRTLIKLGYKIINSGYITNIPLESLLNYLENELFNLTNQINKPKTSTSAQLLNNIFFELKEKSLNPRLPGLTSGFKTLDFLTQGFQKAELIILAGRPSLGKTALSLNILVNSIKSSRLPILFFSLEMTTEQIIYRILSSETKINQLRLKSGRLYQTDWVRLNKIIQIVSKLPLFIDDTANLSIQEIRSKIKTILINQNNLGLVIIDYLQLIKLTQFRNINRVQELSQITRSLKNLAREFDIPIIVLSQLNRNIETRTDKKPLLSDLRESGSIEQDADLILMLSKPIFSNTEKRLNKQSSIRELIIAKQRNGPTGKITLEFIKNQMRFIELGNFKLY